ncbi:DUF3299 domain-containing protein [Thauera sp.]|uniref:DUF3299 domain-containing protein n=1 Tax=Thauera sp. TaxID=1905334 RepID=UPI002608D694|nr:DUF3299 domain-containing protein [Thauera sp.]
MNADRIISSAVLAVLLTLVPLHAAAQGATAKASETTAERAAENTSAKGNEKANANASDKSSAGYQVGERLVVRVAKVKGGFVEISWDDLIPTDWNPEGFLADLKLDQLEDNDPRAMEALQRMRAEWDHAPLVERMAGASVRLPGFVVPLETDGKKIREFLLVPYFGACVHVPPPPANQLIHVIPDKPVPAAWNMMPVWVSGVMAVGRIDSEMGVAGYQLRAVKVEEYKEDPPQRE